MRIATKEFAIKMRVFIRVAVGMLLPLSGGFAAELVFEQSSIPLGNPSSGAVAVFSSESDIPSEPRAKAWDNFSISEDMELSGLTWRGAFNTEFNPNPSFRGEIDFKIEVFANTVVAGANEPLLSSPLLLQEIAGGTAGNDDGVGISKVTVPNATTAPRPTLGQQGGVFVDYSADLEPIALKAGDYWLSIVGIQTFPSPHPDFSPNDPNAHFDPAWSWVFSADGDTQFYSFDELEGDTAEPGLLFPRDLTFSLFGEAASALLGDFNDNDVLDVDDIDLLAAGIRSSSTDTQFDVNADGVINLDDHAFWVSDLVGTLAGDSDLNRSVAFEDFVALSNGFGKPGGWGNGDFDGDGEVKFSDFLALSRNFGEQAGPISAAQSVPEPGALWQVLILLGVAFVDRKGRRRRPCRNCIGTA